MAKLPGELSKDMANKTTAVQLPVIYVNQDYQNIVQKE
jgi:hypothetical protein